MTIWILQLDIVIHNVVFSLGHRHPGESRDPGFKPSFKEMFKTWTPAFAGVTIPFYVWMQYPDSHKWGFR